MAKTTKPNVAKSTPAKAIKTPARKSRKWRKNQHLKKTPLRKGNRKPVTAKAAIKKPQPKQLLLSLQENQQ